MFINSVSKVNHYLTNLEPIFIPIVCDITNIRDIDRVLDRVSDMLGGVDIIVVASGVGELNPLLRYDLEYPALMTNVVGWTCVVDWAVNFFDRQGFGNLVSISSVGGLRGSGVAPAYNATKAFQINYMEGLMQRTFKSSKGAICVTDIRPGFVDTAMAKGDGIFWLISPDKACRKIFRAIEKRKRVVYISRRWRLVAFVLRFIPWVAYRRM